MLCCLPKAHHHAKAAMAKCHHQGEQPANCTGWQCAQHQAPEGGLNMLWLPFTGPSLTGLISPGPAGSARTIARTRFASALRLKDPPPPRS